MPKRDALERDRCRHLVLGSQQVSEGQLAKVLKRVAENPALLEDLPSRMSLARARVGVADEIMDSESLDLAAGGTWLWHFSSLPKLLPFVLSHCPGLAAVYEAALDRRPNSRENRGE